MASLARQKVRDEVLNAIFDREGHQIVIETKEGRVGLRATLGLTSYSHSKVQRAFMALIAKGQLYMFWGVKEDCDTRYAVVTSAECKRLEGARDAKKADLESSPTQQQPTWLAG